ncbi:MAG: ComEC/Rec2 family competence protein [Christensenella sp.]|nr:ComEC/Rec2 family competence protein [Christensenella sp.]
MEQDFQDLNKPSLEERSHRKRSRILLILLLVLALAAVAIAATLLHSAAPDAAVATAAVVSPSVPAATASPSPSPTPVGLLVTFLDVGQGDAAFLQSPSGKTMLIDGGPESAFSTIDQLLTARGVVGLDTVIASHLHADHIGGLIQLVDTYPIGNFYYPPFDAESETYFQLLDALKESQATVSSPLAGKDTLIPWDDAVEIRILAPYQTVYSDYNDTSYILRVSYGNTAVLFTGDATSLGEKLAMKAQPNHCFEATVLKVGHHGSSDSTSAKFLKAVSPSIAVISVGKNNDYGLPDEALLNRLKDAGVTVYRTDESGAITLLLDGTNVTVVE